MCSENGLLATRHLGCINIAYKPCGIYSFRDLKNASTSIAIAHDMWKKLENRSGSAGHPKSRT